MFMIKAEIIQCLGFTDKHDGFNTNTKQAIVVIGWFITVRPTFRGEALNAKVSHQKYNWEQMPSPVPCVSFNIGGMRKK